MIGFAEVYDPVWKKRSILWEDRLCQCEPSRINVFNLVPGP